MNRIAIGTVQFGLPYGIANRVGQVSRTEARAMLQFASESCIDTLDTAITYGDSETCLGALGTQGFKLVTKLPALPDNCPDVADWVKQQMNESLTRLGVSAVYAVLLHRPKQLQGLNGSAIYRALQRLKESGQAQKVGVSIYSPDELTAVIPRYRFDMVQAPLNLIDRRLCSGGFLQRLKDAGIEIHTRSPFLQGLLLMAQDDIPKKFSTWNKLWQVWHQWLADHDSSAVHACLAFPLSFAEIDRVVVGADSLRQLAQIVSAANSQPIYDSPDLQCEDQNLINPAHWATL
jgi:aryl-alcohol dehydrogenase-like predicted oxidoreductase